MKTLALKCRYCGTWFAAKVFDGLPAVDRLHEHVRLYHQAEFLAVRLRAWQTTRERLPNELKG